MWTIFLDIDGTLISSQGAGLKSMLQVMSERFQISEIPPIEVHGRTDYGIWHDVFHSIGIPAPNDLAPLIQHYCEHLRVNLEKNTGSELPGVKNLLSTLSNRDDVAIGLLTGNAKVAAEIKLSRFGLDKFVEEFGGFGDRSSCRNEVAGLAKNSASLYLKDDFDSDRMWVIGDTVHDISCARSIGARAMAVGTGGGIQAHLTAAKPDAIFADLSNTEEIVDWLFTG